MENERKPRAMIFGFTAVAVLGIGSFALAFKTFPSRLSAPFNLFSPSDASDISFSTDFAKELETQTKDTDQDGLPDVQELKAYKSSPFLEDSDSDGFTDGEEVKRGTDPNCPEGTDCRALIFPYARDIEQERIVKGLYESTISSKIAETGIPGFTDALTIRKLLKQSGMSDEVINQFSDEELVGIFQEAVQKNNNLPQPPLNLKGGENGNAGESGQLPENPTPDEIRKLLVDIGIDKNMLDVFTNEQLTGLYQDTLKEVNKK